MYVHYDGPQDEMVRWRFNREVPYPGPSSRASALLRILRHRKGAHLGSIIRVDTAPVAFIKRRAGVAYL
jgi:hypothetical protein